MRRSELLAGLSRAVAALDLSRPARVAIDGVDGAGKTVLANELAPLIEADGRTVIRASIDGFHRPRKVRYQRGSDSPEGFYHDSFDYDRLRSALLDPLGPGGNLRYRTAAFDWRTDSEVDVPERTAPSSAVLLFDGIFAQRQELLDAWDFVIFLDVNFKETLRRLQIRDAGPDKTPRELERRFWTRYADGQRLYFAAAQPSVNADVVIDNGGPKKPLLLRQGEAFLSANFRA